MKNTSTVSGCDCTSWCTCIYIPRCTCTAFILLQYPLLEKVCEFKGHENEIESLTCHPSEQQVQTYMKRGHTTDQDTFFSPKNDQIRNYMIVLYLYMLLYAGGIVMSGWPGDSLGSDQSGEGALLYVVARTTWR